MSNLLMLACIVFAAFFWLQIRKAAKHDRVLFPFCQLRRDIMCFLREHMPDQPNALSREEYDSVLRLLDVVSDVIHHYNRHKTVMFNFRRVIKFSMKYRDTLEQAKPIEMTGNAKIQEFHHRFVGLLAKAFIAYTPLIRWEMVLRFIAYIYRARKEAAERVVNDARQARIDARDARSYA